jgi:hypothetical protein
MVENEIFQLVSDPPAYVPIAIHGNKLREVIKKTKQLDYLVLTEEGLVFSGTISDGKFKVEREVTLKTRSLPGTPATKPLSLDGDQRFLSH